MKRSQEPKYKINKRGRIENRVSGEEIPDDEPVMIFRARDKNAILAIDYYKGLCSNSEHREAVHCRISDFEEYGNLNMSKLKEPDTDISG